MREIKFRAWDKIEKFITPVEEWNFHQKWVGIGIQISPDEAKLQKRQLEDVELMQFTGLKDKNGVEIYERDVVEWTTNLLGQEDHSKGWIVWHDKYARFNVAWPPDTKDHYGTFRFLHPREKESELQVTGNIYETPELLKA